MIHQICIPSFQVSKFKKKKKEFKSSEVKKSSAFNWFMLVEYFFFLVHKHLLAFPIITFVYGMFFPVMLES